MAFTPSYKNDKSNIVKGNISASIEVCLGDLLILENGLLVPANQIINQGSLLANREYAASRFAGVASQNSELNSEDNINLWSFGEFEMVAATGGLVIGQKLTFADGGGGILSRNEVAFSTDDMLAIGIVLRSNNSDEFKTWFRLESRVFALALSGGSPAGPPTFKYLVGAASTNAPFQSVQAAVTAAEAEGGRQLIPILPGLYTEDVTIAENNIILYGFSGLGDNSPIAAGLTEIVGDVTYSGLTEQYLSMSNLLISGQILIEGTEPVILWLNDSRISTNGQIALEMTNSDGVTRVIARDCVFNTTDASTAVNLSGASSIFFTDCQVTTNDGGLGTANAIETSAGGDGINLTNCFVNGRILKTGGNAGGTFRGAATVIQIASGPCINKTGGSGAFFILDTNFFSGSGNCIAGGSAGDNFVQSIALQFGTGIDNSIVTKLDIDAEVLYDPATPGNWSPAPARVKEALDQLGGQIGGGLFLDPIILVRTEADLPAAAADVITLVGGKTYFFLEIVTLTGDNRIVTTGATITGIGPNYSGLTSGSALDQALLSASGPFGAGSPVIENVRLSNANGSLFNLDGGPFTSGDCKIVHVHGTSYNEIGKLDQFTTVLIDNCEFDDQSTANGLRIDSGSFGSATHTDRVIVRDCYFLEFTATALNFEFGDFQSIYCHNNIFQTGALDEAIRTQAAAVNVEILNLFSNTFLGAGTYLANFTVEDPGVFSIGNENISNTRAAVTYNPAIPANWSPAVTNVESALDQIAPLGFLDPIILVRSEADLPAAIADVITLDGGKTYFFLEKVSLTGDNRIDMQNSNIDGLGRDFSGILREGSATNFPLLTNDENFNALSSVKNIELSNPAGSLFLFKNNILTQSVWIDSVFATNYATIGTIDLVREIRIRDCVFDDIAQTNGLVITGPAPGLKIDLLSIQGCVFNVQAGDGVDMSVGDYDRVDIFNNAFNVEAAATAIKGVVDSTNILSEFRMYGNTFSGSGTYLEAMTICDGPVYANSNFGDVNGNEVQNSLPKTAAYIAAGDEVTTVIALVNTPVVVLGTWTLAALLCKFDENGNPGGGDLRYIGTEENVLTFNYKLMIEPLLGTNKQYTVYIRKNGVTLELSSRDVVSADAANPSKIVGIAQIEASLNDVFELVVENNTDTQDCLVTAASIVIQGSA